VRKGRAYKFRVTFARPEDANASSIQVSGPNGFSAEATRTSLRHARGGRYVATYTVSPADGRFDAGDNGSCTIASATPPPPPRLAPPPPRTPSSAPSPSRPAASAAPSSNNPGSTRTSPPLPCTQGKRAGVRGGRAI